MKYGKGQRLSRHAQRRLSEAADNRTTNIAKQQYKELKATGLV